MFLCKECHKDANCEVPLFLHSQSFGPCEKCKHITTCLDCHDYNFNKPKHTEGEKVSK